jgi:hypothetical protein
MAIMNPIPTRTAPPDGPPSPPPRPLPQGPRRGLSVFWVARVLCFRETPPIVPPAAPKLGGLSAARTPPATSWRHAGGLPGPDPGSNSPGAPPAGAAPRSSSSRGTVPATSSRPPTACRGDVSRHRAAPRASWSAPSTGQACRSSTRSSSVTCPLDAGRRRGASLAPLLGAVGSMHPRPEHRALLFRDASPLPEG